VTGSALFSPLTLGAIELPNRVVVSPMCQYSAHEGHVTEWHRSHLASLAMGGAGLVFVEASAVERRGRITHGCTGLWSDGQIEGMRGLVDLIHHHGACAAVQIAHAGPKANTARPWENGYRPLGPAQAAMGEHSWESAAPTTEPTDEGWRAPRALTSEDFPIILNAYRRATRRAEAAGFDVLEVHGAHGYLLHCFLSPLVNRRTDAYGSDFAGRMRFPLEVVEAVRAEWPADKPLFYRTSAVDGVEGGLTMDDTVAFARELKSHGVDVLDCSSTGIRGATAVSGGVPKGEGYQVPYAARVREETGMATMTVGLIRRPEHAEEIVAEGSADLVALGRELLHDPFWPRRAAETLGVDPDMASWPAPYGWWLVRRKRAEGF
jgi:2,4-dienoyl-CoA reductase-like NADH-dependent reductase (Old Yellow Enzyme family)